jgi:peptide/nickel transport system substrate-binding protein
LLGPVEATLDGRPIPLGATKQRALLAMLALEPNVTVPVARLVDGLWGEDPPATATKMVQLYVSQLRRLLAAEGTGAAIVTHGRGYELRMDAEAVDVVRLQRLVERAARADEAVSDAAREALALWHGGALADVAGEPFAATEIRRLDELRLRATELAAAADLAAGREREALARIEPMIEAHPLHERLHALRMLALYRAGRQADALAAFVAARWRLVDEAGLEPGVELRALHERILRQDPALLCTAAEPATAGAGRRGAPHPAADDRPPRRGRSRSLHPRPLLLAAGVVIALTVALVAALRAGGPQGLSGIEGGAVGVIDPDSATITQAYRVGSASGPITAGGRSVWLADPDAGTVARIRPDGGDPVVTIPVGPAPVGLAFGAGSLWVAGGEAGEVVQVAPSTDRIVQRIPVGNGLRSVAVGYGAVWAATALDGEVVRIDLRTRAEHWTAVGDQPVAVAVGAGAVWAVAEESGTLVRIDPRSGDVLAPIAVGNGPSAVAVGAGAVWTANRQDGTVSRVDPATDRVTATLPAGRAPTALTVADGALWVADASGAILRLDPRTGATTDTITTSGSPIALTTADGAIWASAAPPPAAHHGGTLRVGLRAILLDPAYGGYDSTAILAVGLAYDGLFGWRRAAGAAGARLVPALARDVPVPTDDGRRYVVRLRPGLTFSDGTPVRATDVRASFERAMLVNAAPGLLPRMLKAVRGIERCRPTHHTCDLSRGIVADDRTGTVVFRLRRPDPELLDKLTFGLLAVVPTGTPHRLLRSRPIPGTGPYRVAEVVPHHRALLTRNPHFLPRGLARRPDGFADRIAIAMGAQRTQVAAAVRGTLDVEPLTSTLTAAQLAGLRTRIGARLRSGAYAFTEYAWLNVHTAPFDDPRVRRALDLAVDRRAVVEQSGGLDAGSPTCQILPPGLPGYRPFCRATLNPSPAGAWRGPDPARARRLVAASGTRGTPVTVMTWPDRRTFGHQLVHTLRVLGYPTRLRVLPSLDALLVAAHDPRQHPQVGFGGWIADVPEPAPMLRALVGCHDLSNASQFCDPSIDRAIERAEAAGDSAGAAWQQVERRIAARAPLIPVVARRQVLVTSPRAGNVQFHPLTGVLLEQVWVR